MDGLLSEPTSWLGLLSSIALIAAGHVVNRYVIPFLKVGKRQKYATYIANIADEITDDLKAAHPDNDWLKYVDDAVDKLKLICGIDDIVARRAINAAVARQTKK